MGKRKRDENDPLWNHGYRIPNQGVVCMHCGTHFVTTLRKFRCHLLGIESQHITVCIRIPQNARDEFAEACIQHGTMPSVGTLRRGPSTMPSVGTLTVAQVGEPLHEPGPSTMPSVGTSTVAQPSSLLLEPGPLSTTTGFRLVAPNLVVGGARQKSFNDVWRCLMDNNIQRIGVCGMAGVGKSTLLKQISNKLLTIANPFQNVFWVQVSQGCNIFKLQSAIASFLNLSLTSSEGERATTLWQALSDRGKSLLILDEVREFLDLQHVGIPDACKLIVATRPPSVCRQLACQETIRLLTLPFEESWNLFMASLGGEPALSAHVESVARFLVGRCNGLPLGIVTIADCMRGEADLTEWKSILLELNGLAPTPRKQVVDLFRSLKLAYDALDDPRLKDVFMLCALLQKGDYIQYGFDFANKQRITSFLVANGLAGGGLKSRHTDFVLMQHALNQLEDAGLLLFNPTLEVNGLLKLMAIWIVKERGDSIVEVVQENLEDLPANEQWTTDLKQVFLVGSCITEINPYESPQCPELLSLYLCGNSFLEVIGNDFFQYFFSLQALDLSNTRIMSLPPSVAGLVNLISLSVSWCHSLKSVGPISSLIKLEKLDMSYSGVEEVPPGMGSLSRLSYFNAVRSRIRDLPQGLLLNFSLLQFLMVTACITGEELEALKRLEILVCGFKFDGTLSQLANVMDAVCRQKLKRFCLYVGQVAELSFCEFSRSYCDLGLEFERTVKLWGTIVVGEEDACTIRLPANIQCLVMKNLFHNGRSLRLEGGALECLVIQDCPALESMPTDVLYQMLSVLKLSSLTNFLSLIAPVPLPHGAFNQLQKLSIVNCPKFESLFPPNLVHNLQNLQQLKVKSCGNMKFIFMDENVTLQNLKILKLCDLPNLGNLSLGTTGCISLRKVYVVNCTSLVEFPLPQPERLELVQVYPREWWELVQTGGAMAGVPVFISPYESDAELDLDSFEADYIADTESQSDAGSA